MRFRRVHIPVILSKILPPEPLTSGSYLTINDITVAEDAGIATFTVTRSGDTSGVSSVDYATTQYTAVAGQDYVATSGTLTFTAGQTSKTVDITINNTTNYEVNELFYLDLTNTVGATLSKTRGICTLTDVSGFPSASSVTSPTASEGNNITFRVDFPRYAQFSVPHTYTLSGTAAAGVDYNFTPISIINNLSNSATAISATSSGGSFTAPVNTMWLDITFALLADASAESAETIILTVDGTASGTGTITDVPPPTISTVSSPSAIEGDNLVFTVTRTGTGGATINYAYSLGGTATAPSDYTATPTLSNGVTISGGDFVVPAAVTSFTATFATVVNGDNGETVILTVGGVAGTGTISQVGLVPLGDSLSLNALSVDVTDRTATTDTINIVDGAANGNFFVIPPASGTFTKTIHKSGTASSFVLSRSRIGYVRNSGSVSTSQKFRVGNADMTLNKSHFIGMLIRINRPSTTTGVEGFTGEFDLLRTSQVGASGNPLFRLFIGGASNPNTLYRRLVCATREGVVGGVAGTLLERANASSNAYSASVYGLTGPTEEWAWVFVSGSDTTDSPYDGSDSTDFTSGETSLVGNNTHKIPNNVITCGYALAGNDFVNRGNVGMRQMNTTTPGLPYWGADFVTPASLSNVDFIIGTNTNTDANRRVDIARVIKLSRRLSRREIAMIVAGWHPKTLGWMTGDDFCLDFDTLPPNTTIIQGAAVYNPAEDGPIVTRYHGDNASDVVLNVVNRRI